MSVMIEIRRLANFDARELRQLGDVLIDCVEGGASVNFMLPMTRNKADTFWNAVAASVARDERAVLVAERDDTIVGTVQVIWAPQENQPHRGEIAKVLVHRRYRRHGIGAALLSAAEQLAVAEGKTLLVLDTASDAAERLYERLGWQRCGRIPGYALWPAGGWVATTVFFKSLTG